MAGNHRTETRPGLQSGSPGLGNATPRVATTSAVRPRWWPRPRVIAEGIVGSTPSHPPSPTPVSPCDTSLYAPVAFLDRVGGHAYFPPPKWIGVGTGGVMWIGRADRVDLFACSEASMSTRSTRRCAPASRP